MNRENLKNICDAFLDETMELNDLPGVALGVTWQGEEFVGVRGVRDVLTGEPLQTEDIFHCASLSKLFTAGAILQLVDAGVLDLSDRLVDVLPELVPKAGSAPEEADALAPHGLGARNAEIAINSPIADKRWQDIRLYQMLSHTSGIGDVTDYHWNQALTGRDALSAYVHSDEVIGQPLLWAPGEGGFRYSNIAFEILGHVVERCAGLSYEEFVQTYLMEPADMADSTMLTFRRLGVEEGASCPKITDAIREGNAASPDDWHPMALPHEKAEDRRIVPTEYYPYTRNHAPSSTLTSNVSDLLKWCRANLAGFAAVEAVTQPAASATGAPAPLLSFDAYQHASYEYAEVPNNREKMGLGWFMRRQGGHQLYGHEGSDDGFRASLWICPQLELGIVVLSNLSGAPVKKLNKKLFEILISS